jgi:TM2 domain-containing membrane protein YozV
MSEPLDTRPCPFCGEDIKTVAIRCKHCHADLSASEPDFDRHQSAVKAAVKATPPAVVKTAPAELVKSADFEQRFLEYAYQASLPLNAASVAYALKIPISEADEQLEDLAARDILTRHVDEEGHVFFRLPGRPQPVAIVPHVGPGAQAITGPQSPQAMAGLLLNLVVPGLGSIVAGKTIEGVLQLVLILIGLPLSFILIGIPICIATWGWALSTGLRAMHEANHAAERAAPRG